MKRLKDLRASTPAPGRPSTVWRDRTKKASWQDFEAVKRDFPAADKYRACVIFDIGGNNYRLIVKIDYQKQLVRIRKALTHAEYDKEKWKSDCDQS